MTIKSKIDQQLEKILSGDTSTLLDAHNETDENRTDEDEPAQTAELVPVVYEKKTTELQLSNSDIQEDYEFARSNLYGLVGRSNAALDLALRISAMSEHPRALEVVAQLIRISSDVSKDLIDIHNAINKSKNATSKEDNPTGKYTQINNNFYNKEPSEISSYLDELPDDIIDNKKNE